MNLDSQRFARTLRLGRSILKASFFSIGVFLLLFVFSHISGALYVSRLSVEALDSFRAGIAEDLRHLKDQGDSIASDELVQTGVLERDSESLIEILTREKDRRSIGLIGVTDSNGVILGRTKSVESLGDNVFLLNPVARVVAGGVSAESVEAPVGFAPNQIFLNTGRPIMRDGKMIGALFANYLADDAYAERFQDMYLPQGVRVVFYNKSAGIYGNGFSDPAVRKLVESYFSTGSEWIQNQLSGKTIRFPNGAYYLVENVVFPGLEESPGGALVFVPRKDFSPGVNVVIAGLVLLVFLFFALRYHACLRGEYKAWRYCVMLACVSVLIFALALYGLYLQKTGYLHLVHVPYELYNSTLRLQPDSGIYSMGFDQRLSVILDTGDESINAVQIGLVFDPKVVEVGALEASSSTCSYIVESIVDQSAGTAKFACVIMKSEGHKASLPIVDVVVKPKVPGLFSLLFDDKETRVLANDGLGTDVLRMSQSGSYRVELFDPASLFVASSTATSSSQMFTVYSPTHPNQVRWYNGSEARFVWMGRPGAVYKYKFDSSPDTVPSIDQTTQSSSVTVPVPGDGVFYFHLQLATGGPLVHYRVQADRTPPFEVSVLMSSDRIVEGDVLRVSFDADDVGSGIQKNYYVNFDDHLFLPTGPELFVPFLEKGHRTMTVRVYDNAGNYAEKSHTVYVEGKD